MTAAAQATPVRLSPMRRAVVRTVTASAAVPQFSVEYDVPVDPLVTAVAAWRGRGHAGVSLIDLVHAATARTLPAHPLLTASFDDERVLLHPQVNLAFLVEVSDGMLSPVLTAAAEMSVPELAAERRRLTAAAAAGTLTPDELFTGTFTVSNLGPFGVPRFTAMVLPPQVAVLAVGAARPGGLLTLTLACDHRVVDGAPAARFLAELGSRLDDGTALAEAEQNPEDS